MVVFQLIPLLIFLQAETVLLFILFNLRHVIIESRAKELGLLVETAANEVRLSKDGHLLRSLVQINIDSLALHLSVRILY